MTSSPADRQPDAIYLRLEPTGFDLLLDGRVLLRHRSDAPCLFVGRGEARMDMYRGNFDIEDYVIERTAARLTRGSTGDSEVSLRAAPGRRFAAHPMIDLGGGHDVPSASVDPDAAHQPALAPCRRGARTNTSGAAASRCPISTSRGRRFPFWTSEPGVGRDKTHRNHLQGRRHRQGGRRLLEHQLPAADLYLISRATRCMWKQPRIPPSISGRRDFHEVEVWAVPERIELGRPRELRGSGRGAFRALRPPAAAARMGLWRRHHRPEGRRERSFERLAQ